MTPKKSLGMIILIPMILNPGPSRAGGLSNIPGAFVDVGLGARSVGMGGASIVLVRDIYSVVWNPAGLISLSGQELSFSTTKQFGLVPYNLLLYGIKFHTEYAFGIGFLSSGDDALRETTVFLTASRLLSLRLSLGLTLKLRFASFGNNPEGEWIFEGGNRQVRGTGRGFGFDLGVRWILGKKIAFGLVLKDLFENISYTASNKVGTAKGGGERVPTSLLLGMGYVVNRDLNFELNLKKSSHLDTEDRLFFGLERRVFPFFKLRGGMNQSIGSAEVGRSYALGFSLAHEIGRIPLDFSLDFAYLINELQNFYHISFSLFWR